MMDSNSIKLAGQNWSIIIYYAGLLEPGGPGGSWSPRILTGQLTLSQQEGGGQIMPTTLLLVPP